MKKFTLLFLSLFIGFSSFSQNVFNLMAEKDNTIYSEDMNKSQGAGIDFISGRNNNGDFRRALLKFDVSTIPNTATVTDVVLELNLNKVPNVGAVIGNVALHALTKDWGEGSSNNAGDPGKGDTADTGDCTWDYTFWSVSQWTNSGGDFEVASMASTSVDGIGTYTWSSANMISKVQDWIDGTSTNNGFIMIGNESTNKSSKRFNSRENSSSPPKLIITIMGTTGLSYSISDPKFSIVPNPVSESFRINGVAEIKKLELYDLKGSKVKTLSPGLRIHNIKDLNRGIYLIKIQGDGFSITQKLIKK